MDNMWSIMDIIFAGAGLYVVYAWYLLKKTGEIKREILMNKDVNLRKCKNLEGYKTFIAPRMLLFGLASVALGLVGLINTYVVSLPAAVYVGCMVLFMVVLIWFTMQSKKALRMFW